MMNAKNPNRQLAEYLRARLEYIEQCKAEFESHLEEQRREFLRSLDNGTLRREDPEVGKITHRREYVVANTFRYTMLVGLCSFLEEAIKETTKRLVSDYDAAIRNAKKGNWLARHEWLLTDECGIDLDPIANDLRKFHDLITLRNCVVHAWGNVAAARNPTAVEAAVDRIDSAEIFKDGFLYFGDQVLPEAIVAGENIADYLLVSKLQTSIT